MSRRLKTIATWINDWLSDDGYHADIVEGYCNTDRKIPGTRLRHPGKGRVGNRLIVKLNGEVVFDHNAAETYRANWEVENWLEKVLWAMKDSAFDKAGADLDAATGDHKEG